MAYENVEALGIGLTLDTAKYSKELSNVSKSTNSILANLTAQADNFAARWDDITRNIRSAKSVLSSMALYATFTGIASAAAAAASAVTTFSMNMETAEIAMRYFVTGADKAAKSLEYLREMQALASETSFTTESAIGLSQFMSAMGIELKVTKSVMHVINDAAAATGASEANMSRIVTSLGQILTKGRLAAEEVRQLANANIPIYDILQEEMGLTGAQIKNIGNYWYDANKSVVAILSGLEKRYKGAADDIAQTMSGMVNSIKDNALMISSIATSGIYDAAAEKLLTVRDALTEYRNTGNNQGSTAVFRDILLDLDNSGKVGTTVLTLVGNFRQLVLTAKDLYITCQPLVKMFGQGLYYSISTLTIGFNALGEVLTGVDDVLGAFGFGLQQVFTLCAGVYITYKVARTFGYIGQAAAALTVRLISTATSIKGLLPASIAASGGLTFLTTTLLAAGGIALYVSGAFDSILSSLANLGTADTGLPNDFEKAFAEYEEKMDAYNEAIKKYEGSFDDSFKTIASDGVAAFNVIQKKAAKSAKSASNSWLASFDEVYKVPEDTANDDKDTLTFPDLSALIDKLSFIFPAKIEAELIMPTFNWNDVYDTDISGGVLSGIKQAAPLLITSIAIGSGIAFKKRFADDLAKKGKGPSGPNGTSPAGEAGTAEEKAAKQAKKATDAFNEAVKKQDEYVETLKHTMNDAGTTDAIDMRKLREVYGTVEEANKAVKRTALAAGQIIPSLPKEMQQAADILDVDAMDKLVLSYKDTQKLLKDNASLAITNTALYTKQLDTSKKQLTAIQALADKNPVAAARIPVDIANKATVSTYGESIEALVTRMDTNISKIQLAIINNGTTYNAELLSSIELVHKDGKTLTSMLSKVGIPTDKYSKLLYDVDNIAKYGRTLTTYTNSANTLSTYNLSSAAIPEDVVNEQKLLVQKQEALLKDIQTRISSSSPAIHSQNLTLTLDKYMTDLARDNENITSKALAKIVAADEYFTGSVSHPLDASIDKQALGTISKQLEELSSELDTLYTTTVTNTAVSIISRDLETAAYKSTEVILSQMHADLVDGFTHINLLISDGTDEAYGARLLATEIVEHLRLLSNRGNAHNVINAMSLSARAAVRGSLDALNKNTYLLYTPIVDTIGAAVDNMQAFITGTKAYIPMQQELRNSYDAANLLAPMDTTALLNESRVDTTLIDEIARITEDANVRQLNSAAANTAALVMQNITDVLDTAGNTTTDAIKDTTRRLLSSNTVFNMLQIENVADAIGDIFDGTADVAEEAITHVLDVNKAFFNQLSTAGSVLDYDEFNKIVQQAHRVLTEISVAIQKLPVSTDVIATARNGLYDIFSAAAAQIFKNEIADYSSNGAIMPGNAIAAATNYNAAMSHVIPIKTTNASEAEALYNDFTYDLKQYLRNQLAYTPPAEYKNGAVSEMLNGYNDAKKYIDAEIDITKQTGALTRYTNVIPDEQAVTKFVSSIMNDVHDRVLQIIKRMNATAIDAASIAAKLEQIVTGIAPTVDPTTGMLRSVAETAALAGDKYIQSLTASGASKAATDFAQEVLDELLASPELFDTNGARATRTSMVAVNLNDAAKTFELSLKKYARFNMQLPEHIRSGIHSLVANNPAIAYPDSTISKYFTASSAWLNSGSIDAMRSGVTGIGESIPNIIYNMLEPEVRRIAGIPSELQSLERTFYQAVGEVWEKYAVTTFSDEAKASYGGVLYNMQAMTDAQIDLLAKIDSKLHVIEVKTTRRQEAAYKLFEALANLDATIVNDATNPAELDKRVYKLTAEQTDAILKAYDSSAYYQLGGIGTTVEKNQVGLSVTLLSDEALDKLDDILKSKQLEYAKLYNGDSNAPRLIAAIKNDIIPVILEHATELQANTRFMLVTISEQQKEAAKQAARANTLLRTNFTHYAELTGNVNNGLVMLSNTGIIGPRSITRTGNQAVELPVPYTKAGSGNYDDVMRIFNAYSNAMRKGSYNTVDMQRTLQLIRNNLDILAQSATFTDEVHTYTLTGNITFKANKVSFLGDGASVSGAYSDFTRYIDRLLGTQSSQFIELLDTINRAPLLQMQALTSPNGIDTVIGESDVTIRDWLYGVSGKLKRIMPNEAADLLAYAKAGNIEEAFKAIAALDLKAGDIDAYNAFYVQETQRLTALSEQVANQVQQAAQVRSVAATQRTIETTAEALSDAASDTTRAADAIIDAATATTEAAEDLSAAARLSAIDNILRLGATDMPAAYAATRSLDAAAQLEALTELEDLNPYAFRAFINTINAGPAVTSGAASDTPDDIWQRINKALEQPGINHENFGYTSVKFTGEDILHGAQGLEDYIFDDFKAAMHTFGIDPSDSKTLLGKLIQPFTDATDIIKNDGLGEFLKRLSQLQGLMSSKDVTSLATESMGSYMHGAKQSVIDDIFSADNALRVHTGLDTNALATDIEAWLNKATYLDAETKAAFKARIKPTGNAALVDELEAYISRTFLATKNGPVAVPSAVRMQSGLAGNAPAADIDKFLTDAKYLDSDTVARFKSLINADDNTALIKEIDEYIESRFIKTADGVLSANSSYTDFAKYLSSATVPDADKMLKTLKFAQDTTVSNFVLKNLGNLKGSTTATTGASINKAIDSFVEAGEITAEEAKALKASTTTVLHNLKINASGIDTMSMHGIANKLDVSRQYQKLINAGKTTAAEQLLAASEAETRQIVNAYTKMAAQVEAVNEAANKLVAAGLADNLDDAITMLEKANNIDLSFVKRFVPVNIADLSFDTLSKTDDIAKALDGATLGKMINAIQGATADGLLGGAKLAAKGVGNIIGTGLSAIARVAFSDVLGIGPLDVASYIMEFASAAQQAEQMRAHYSGTSAAYMSNKLDVTSAAAERLNSQAGMNEALLDWGNQYGVHVASIGTQIASSMLATVLGTMLQSAITGAAMTSFTGPGAIIGAIIGGIGGAIVAAAQQASGGASFHGHYGESIKGQIYGHDYYNNLVATGVDEGYAKKVAAEQDRFSAINLTNSLYENRNALGEGLFAFTAPNERKAFIDDMLAVSSLIPTVSLSTFGKYTGAIVDRDTAFGKDAQQLYTNDDGSLNKAGLIEADKLVELWENGGYEKYLASLGTDDDTYARAMYLYTELQTAMLHKQLTGDNNQITDLAEDIVNGLDPSRSLNAYAETVKGIDEGVALLEEMLGYSLDFYNSSAAQQLDVATKLQEIYEAANLEYAGQVAAQQLTYAAESQFTNDGGSLFASTATLSDRAAADLQKFADAFSLTAISVEDLGIAIDDIDTSKLKSFGIAGDGLEKFRSELAGWTVALPDNFNISDISTDQLNILASAGIQIDTAGITFAQAQTDSESGLERDLQYSRSLVSDLEQSVLASKGINLTDTEAQIDPKLIEENLRSAFYRLPTLPVENLSTEGATRLAGYYEETDGNGKVTNRVNVNEGLGVWHPDTEYFEVTNTDILLGKKRIEDWLTENNTDGVFSADMVNSLLGLQPSMGADKYYNTAAAVSINAGDNKDTFGAYTKSGVVPGMVIEEDGLETVITVSNLSEDAAAGVTQVLTDEWNEILQDAELNKLLKDLGAKWTTEGLYTYVDVSKTFYENGDALLAMYSAVPTMMSDLSQGALEYLKLQGLLNDDGTLITWKETTSSAIAAVAGEYVAYTDLLPSTLQDALSEMAKNNEDFTKLISSQMVKFDTITQEEFDKFTNTSKQQAVAFEDIPNEILYQYAVTRGYISAEMDGVTVDTIKSVEGLKEKIPYMSITAAVEDAFVGAPQVFKDELLEWQEQLANGKAALTEEATQIGLAVALALEAGLNTLHISNEAYNARIDSGTDNRFGEEKYDLSNKQDGNVNEIKSVGNGEYEIYYNAMWYKIRAASETKALEYAYYLHTATAFNPDNFGGKDINAVMKIKGKANGGIVSDDGLYRIAEQNRKEAIIPLENPTVSKHIGTAIFNMMAANAEWRRLSAVSGLHDGGLSTRLANERYERNAAAQQSSNSVEDMANAILQRVLPAMAQQQPDTVVDDRVPMYVGTLIADDNGLRELNSKLKVIEAKETRRR